MNIAPIEDRRLTGIALILTAVIVFTGIDTCAKWLVLAGLPPMVVVFARYCGHMLLVAGLFLPSRRKQLFATANWRLEIARAGVLLASTTCNFMAVQYLPLTLTSAIFFTVPLWVCALSIPLLGEKVGIRRWAAIIVGLGGALIATQPWGADFHWAVIFSVAAAIFTAFYSILTRRLAGVDSTETQQFYAATLATIFIAPVALSQWSWPEAGIDWLAFCLIGCFGFVGHQMLTIAHRFAPASTLAPFMYIQMLSMTTSSWVVFDTPPDLWVLIGASLVLSSGLYVWIRERQLVRKGRKALHPASSISRPATR